MEGFISWYVYYASRSGDNDVPFVLKVQTIMIQVFTFFVDAELLVYEIGENKFSLLVILLGSDSALDIERAKLLISLLIFKRDTFSLLTVLVSEYSPEGLMFLSQHLLGVSALCEDVSKAIQRLTFRLCTVIGEELLKRNDDLNLSLVDPSISSLHRLEPFLLDYFQWLRSHKGPLVKLCRVVEVVHCVHPSLRFFDHVLFSLIHLDIPFKMNPINLVKTLSRNIVKNIPII